jgi:ribose-phosphate pyrophosphokinase
VPAGRAVGFGEQAAAAFAADEANDGAWPSGKARDFGSRIRRFESFRPNHTMSRGQLKLFSGSAHRALAGEIAEFLGVNVGQARLQRFPDTECSFQIDENIRGTDVFVVQPTCADVDRNLIELCVMIDAFRRSSASRITAVVPYYGYARQDRKDKPRVPISAKLVANLLSAAGANRVLTMDLHKAQIQGFFDIPVDHLFAAPVIIDYCDRLAIPDLTIVSPDAGGAERARAYAKRLDAELAIIDKRRSDDGSAEVMNVIGDVSGRTCIIQDDIIDTAGTIVKAAVALKGEGAERVFACAVHGVLSGPAIERLEAAPIEQVIITNTIPLNSEKARCCKKIKQLSVARLLGQAIRSIHEETSVSSLFV